MSTFRPFRFSAVIETPQSLQEWQAKARRVEELGYTTLLIPDHLKLVDPAVGMMAAASVTSLRVGSHVFCNDFRHPVLLARQAANIDLFTDGRFQFGLGCGYLADEYQQAGIPMGPAGERISRFEEALHIIKAYFHNAAPFKNLNLADSLSQGEAATAAEDEACVSFSGQYYQVQNLAATIQPVQKPHPPIYIGGGGKRILSIAAREADIIGLGARSTARGLDWTSALTEANKTKIEWIREAAGERFNSLEFSNTIFIVAVTDHAAGAAYGIGQHLGLTPDQVLDCAQILVGPVDQIVEKLQERRAQYGISSIEVTEAHVEALAPVVARLAGK